MEVTHTEESRAADAELNAALEAEANDKPASQPDQDEQAARLRDLSTESVAEDDIFQDMDFTPTEELRAADAEVNAALEAEANDKPASQPDQDKRAARIRDLSTESLAKDDSFQACLGASTAGMMQIEKTLQERIIVRSVQIRGH